MAGQVPWCDRSAQSQSSRLLGVREHLHSEGPRFPGWLTRKESACQAGDARDMVGLLGQDDPLKEEKATQSNILAWKVPWTEEPGGLQSMGLHRLIHV